MMDALGGYLMHLTAAAILCSIVLRLQKGSQGTAVITKLICGIFLAYSIVKPVPELGRWEPAGIMREITQDAEEAVSWGEAVTGDALSESISKATEAYILEKANAMNADLAVEVELSDDEMPIPVSVSLSGAVSPYTKTLLSDLIKKDLNISKERQIWKSP